MSFETSQETGEINKALSAAQAQVKGAAKDAENPFFHSKYADLASIWDACREALTDQDLAVIQSPSTAFSGEPEVYTFQSKKGEDRSGVRIATTVSVLTRLAHSSGQWMQGTTSAMLPAADPQAVGSAITYLRRYALAAMVGVAPEDDDGEATARPVPHREPAARRPVGVDEDGVFKLPGDASKWDGHGGKALNDPSIPVKTLEAAKRWMEKTGDRDPKFKDQSQFLVAAIGQEIQRRTEAAEAKRQDEEAENGDFLAPPESLNGSAKEQAAEKALDSLFAGDSKPMKAVR